MLIIAALLFSTQGLASDPQKQEDKSRKRAYKYRDDISKQVYKKIKSWTRPAVLHSDWIENSYGRSLDLQGNELFPSVDYTGLRKVDSLRYVISKYAGGKTMYGLIRADGGFLIPMEYSTISAALINKGYVIAKKNEVATELTDVYTSDGVCLCSLQDVKDVLCKYDPYYNTILVSYKPKNSTDTKNTYAAYYPDGICIGGPVQADKAESKGCFRYYIDGECREINDTILSRQPHASLTILSDAQIEAEVRKNFLNNLWIKKAQEYANEKRYQQTLDCYRFFGDFDNYIFLNSGSFNTSSQVLYYALLLETSFNTGNYKQIIDAANGSSFELAPFLYGLYFNQETQSFQAYPILYQENVRNLVQKLEGICTKIYTNAVSAYKQRQEQRAQLWGAILGAVAAGTVNAVTGNRGKTTSASSSQGTAATLQTTTPATNSSSSSSSRSSEPAKKTCRVCNGTGREPHETYMGSASSGKKKWCSDCGKEVYVGHSHRTCSLCKGTGLY